MSPTDRKTIFQIVVGSSTVLFCVICILLPWPFFLNCGECVLIGTRISQTTCENQNYSVWGWYQFLKENSTDYGLTQLVFMGCGNSDQEIEANLPALNSTRHCCIYRPVTAEQNPQITLHLNSAGIAFWIFMGLALGSITLLLISCIPGICKSS